MDVSDTSAYSTIGIDGGRRLRPVARYVTGRAFGRYWKVRPQTRKTLLAGIARARAAAQRQAGFNGFLCDVDGQRVCMGAILEI